MKQLVVIDDSGDPSFNSDKGSSTHFIIACVIFDDPIDAEETALVIKKFRRKLGWSEAKEFKFNKLRKDLLVDLLTELARAPFKVRAISVDKRKIYSAELQSKQDSFYNYVIKLVLSKITLNHATIKLDGHAGRTYKKSAETYFRRELNDKSGRKQIGKFKFVDSRADVLIQLADLVAGSINRHRSQTKTDWNTYLPILEKGGRIENIWDFQ